MVHSMDGLSMDRDRFSLANDQPLSSALPVHIKFSLSSNSTSSSGFVNSGFYGIKVDAQTYNASFFYKPLHGASVAGGKLIVGLRNSNNTIMFGSTTVDVSGAPVGQWSTFVSLINVVSAASSALNQFFIELPPGSNGDFEFNLISCFPPTFKSRINGARIDIAQVFTDLKPGFVRLPGGSDLEGSSIPERFIWNNTIGPLKNRPGRRGTWIGYNTEGFGID